MKVSPEVARVRASVASNTRWAAEPDRTAATARMRAGFIEKLHREAREQLGPNATDEQVIKAADSALKAHYARMRLKSLMSRRAAREGRQRAQQDSMLNAVAVSSRGR